MTRTKEAKNWTQLEKEARFEKIKTAYWFCQAFNFSDVTTLQYINSGIIGKKKDGSPKTISKSTFYDKYKKQFTDPPNIFEDLKRKSTEGYLELLTSIQNALDTLTEMSGQNLLAKGITAVQKQMIIDSIVTKILPAKASAANAIKKMIDKSMLEPPKELKQIGATKTEADQ